MKENRKYKIVLIEPGEGESLGIRGIGSFLNLKGVDTLTVQYSSDEKESILRTIREFNPVIVGFSLIYQKLFPDFAELIVFLRNHKIRSHFTMGGHFPTIESIKILEYLPELDSIIKGEGEITLFELYKKITLPWMWDNIDGLCYRDQLGKIKINPPRKLIENLDELPFPERGKTTNHKKFRQASLLSSRGCFHNCSYCTNHSFYNNSVGIHRRSRSPQSVVKEMEYLHYAKGIQVFNFENDDFFIKTKTNRNWAHEFTEELKEKNLIGKIAWKMLCKVDDIEKEILTEFKKSGLISVYLEIESGNNPNLKVFNKRYDTGDFLKAVDILNSINLSYEISITLLNPYSTFESLKEDLNFIKKISESATSVIHISKMMAYAGTPIFNQLVTQDRLTGTFSYPNYNFIDNRIDLFELFLHKAFNFRNNDKNGLVQLLRYAKFDHLLESTFNPGIGYYFFHRNIRPLVSEANQQLIETMQQAIELMDSLSYDEILNYWPILDNIVDSHIEKEQHTTFLLNELLDYQLNFNHSEIVN